MALCCLVACPKDIIGNKQKHRATNPPIEPLGLCYHT